jgi:hypothetical protein
MLLAKLFPRPSERPCFNVAHLFRSEVFDFSLLVAVTLCFSYRRLVLSEVEGHLAGAFVCSHIRATTDAEYKYSPSSRRATGSPLLELLHHALEFGISRAKLPREPVPTSLDNSFPVRYHLELTRFARRQHGFNTQPLLDQGHETRDLDLVVLSSRAVHDFYLHRVLQSAQRNI